MGMYDTINGEQVKCFPWVSLYENEITYHGGDLKYYGTGDEVPYKKAHYNYGKNFIILDLDRFPESEYSYYDYVLHVIVDGKVKDSFKDKIGDIDWSINNTVIGYDGTLLNIHSSDDVVNFITEQRKYWEEYRNIKKHSDELFKEMMKYSSGIGSLDKESEEYKNRKKKIDEIIKLIDKEHKNINSDIDALSEKYSYLYVDTSNINDLISLGEFISASKINFSTDANKIKKICKENILSLLAADNTLYDRYVAWQGSDEYIREYVR